MSRRAIKRYEQALDSEKHADASVESSDGDLTSSQEDPKPVVKQSLFALLSEDTDAESSEDEPEAANVPVASSEAIELNENHDSHAAEATTASAASGTQDSAEECAQTKTVKKKKKRRRKGKKNQPKTLHLREDPDWIALNEANPSTENHETPTPGWIPSSYFSEHDGEDVKAEAMRIMQSIEALVMAEKANDLGESSATENATLARVLQVETRLLSADAELKRLFGSRVIESERRGDDASANVRARRRGHSSGRANLRRKISLVSPRENWFPEAPGLIMALDKDATDFDSSRLRYYRYLHESSYAKLQDEYRVLMGTHDPNALVAFSSQYPYHVDSMLQLAEIYRQMGELDRAAEMVERCLYVLENAWNISFKPYDGSCRLRFDVIENRSLYVALFRYSQLLTRRGLHRTALEISKLLLNFDPSSDPMGMLMLADSFALLSGEYEWIQNMRIYYKHIPLQYFPNFSASAAMAAESTRLGLSGISSKSASKVKKAREGAHKDSTSGGVTEADELLTDALLTFPMLLRPLLSAIQDDSGVWMEHRLFDEAWYKVGYDDHGVLIRMSRVYAERSKLLWNSATNKQLLLRCARAAGELDTAAGTGIDPGTGRSSPAFVRDESRHARVAKCRRLRSEAGEWLKNSGLYQEVQIADFTDSTTNLPAELLAGEGADQPVGAVAPRQVTLAESAMEFLQSLLPWRDARDAQ
eukprot:GFKZ01004250.1.p1 GENE.GFKZ01004250.1~~GFKZ01004250.1.p1  ORF type:complete len:704 (-),score=103.08 GFKZ01004250.1:419-2530(-)